MNKDVVQAADISMKPLQLQHENNPFVEWTLNYSVIIS